jgi:hypothetical protein
MFTEFHCTVIITVDMNTWETTLHKAILDYGVCYQSLGFCHEVRCRQHIQLHLCSTLKQFHIYHGYNLLNQLLSLMALECMDYSKI